MSEREVVASDGSLAIRAMLPRADDYGLLAEWRNRPHVRRFWDPDLPDPTPDSIAQEYREDLSPDSKSSACIVELDGRPIGFIQFYRWADWAEDAEKLQVPYGPDDWSLDVFIGEEDSVDRGIGTRLVNLLTDHLFEREGAATVSLLTDVENGRAQRCYEKAGFRKIKTVLDTDTYRGERITCWFMLKEPV